MVLAAGCPSRWRGVEPGAAWELLVAQALKQKQRNIEDDDNGVDIGDDYDGDDDADDDDSYGVARSSGRLVRRALIEEVVMAVKMRRRW